MNNYLFIYKNEDKIEYGKVLNSKLSSYFVKKFSDFEIGDIYRTRIVKKVDALHCFFVELKNGKNGFLDFKDTIGEVKVGDVIFVEIYKINAGEKAPNVSMNFSVSSMFSVVSNKNREDILISKNLKEHNFNIDKIKNIKSNFSVKLRTKSVNCDEDTLLQDIRKNVEKMQEIVDSLNNLPVPKLIYKKENFLEDFLFENEKYPCVLNDKELYKSFKDNKFLKNELKYDEEYSPKYDYNIGVYIEGLIKKTVEIDDINISNLSEKSILNLYSYISQSVFLFKGSVFDNITLYNDYPKEKVKEILKKVGLEKFIPEMDNPDFVGENGINLSGGEKQRISIARALIRETDILVADEILSNLDNETALKIERELLNLNEITLIAVTHRLFEETLTDFDEIIVINEGNVVETGTFKELIDLKGFFYKIYNLSENSKIPSK